MKPVRWFAELGRDDIASAGVTGANLGELTRAGFRVPAGFVVTAAAFLDAIDQGGVREQLRDGFGVATARLDDPDTLHAVAERLQTLVREAGIPPATAAEILDAYHQLGRQWVNPLPVAVRSSATAQDTADTSFAGMHETFANVVGDTDVLERIIDCWCSLYGERAIGYRASQRLTEEPTIAVVVQTLVRAERAGVMLCADPASGDQSNVVIEAAFGLGEVVAGGEVQPDCYVLSKCTPPRMLQSSVGHKTYEITPAPGGDVTRVDLVGSFADRRVLRDEEAVSLAELAVRVEQHYGSPQNIEWAIAGGSTYLLHARPITPLDRRAGVASPDDRPRDRDEIALLLGLGAPAGRSLCSSSTA